MRLSIIQKSILVTVNSTNMLKVRFLLSNTASLILDITPRSRLLEIVCVEWGEIMQGGIYKKVLL